MTIREELQKMGPERVRAGMIAFEHRAKSPQYALAQPCPDDGGICCFLGHAADDLLRHEFGDAPAIEVNFENWVQYRQDGRYVGGREVLRLECVAYLAEHGTAVEIAPKKSPRAIRVAAVLCLLLLVLVV